MEIDEKFTLEEAQKKLALSPINEFGSCLIKIDAVWMKKMRWY